MNLLIYNTTNLMHSIHQNEDIKIIYHVICEQTQLKNFSLYLCGSVARNESCHLSDIDLIIVTFDHKNLRLPNQILMQIMENKLISNILNIYKFRKIDVTILNIKYFSLTNKSRLQILVESDSILVFGPDLKLTKPLNKFNYSILSKKFKPLNWPPILNLYKNCLCDKKQTVIIRFTAKLNLRIIALRCAYLLGEYYFSPQRILEQATALGALYQDLAMLSILPFQRPEAFVHKFNSTINILENQYNYLINNYGERIV